MGHIALLIIALGFIVPRWYDVLIPPPRRGEGKIPYAPGVLFESVVSSSNSDVDGMESGDRGDKKEVVQDTPEN